MIRTDGAPTIAWADPPATCQLSRVNHVHKVELTDEEIGLLAEALDSHVYWQLSDENYRNDGFVRSPGSDDPYNAAEIERSQSLEDKLRDVIRAHAQQETAI